jgi:hypothetical protein
MWSVLADQQLRPNPDWSLRGINRTGFSNTNTGQAEVERRFSEGIGFQFFYVYSRSLTTADNSYDINATAGGMVPEYANLYQYPNPVGAHFSSPPNHDELLKMVYFNSANIPPHRIRFNGIVDLPFGRGKHWGTDVSGPLNQLIGGWQVAFIGDWRSGFWRSVTRGSGIFRNPLIRSADRIEMTIFNQRQLLWLAGDFDPGLATATTGNLEAYVPPNRSQRAIHPYGENFDNRVPQPLADGTARTTNVLLGHYHPYPRNFYMGPRSWNFDFSIFKSITFAEDVNVRLTADFFNIFNHPNNPDPNQTTGLVNLGIQINEPRVVQFSLRVDW